jgi:hypothetical protein
MGTTAIRAHFDGKHIQLDEPVELAPNAKLLITVVPEAGDVPASTNDATISELGRSLIALRKQIVDSGEPLLDWDDIEREKAEARGLRSSAEE